MDISRDLSFASVKRKTGAGETTNFIAGGEKLNLFFPLAVAALCLGHISLGEVGTSQHSGAVPEHPGVCYRDG